MKPIIRILIITIISFSFCHLIFELFRYGIKKFSIHKHDQLNELLQSNAYYDLIFLGSSSVRGDIDPRIIDSICNISSYNAGVEGGNLLEFKMILNAYLVNHPPPKYLMLTLDFASFDLNRKFFNHLDYYPYLSNKVIDQELCNNGHQTALLKILPFIELTEYDEEMRSRCVKGLLGKNEIMPDQIAYKGFLTRSVIFQSDIPLAENYFVEKKVSEGSLELFHGIKDTCKARNIKLIINFPPVYNMKEQIKIMNINKIYKTICSLPINNEIPFIDDSKLSLGSDFNFFSDFAHLNKYGAEKYSLILGNKLEDIIKKPD